MRGVSDYCLRVGMDEIEDEDYLETLREIMEKKAREVKESNPLIKKQKIVKYALSKGRKGLGCVILFAAGNGGGLTGSVQLFCDDGWIPTTSRIKGERVIHHRNDLFHSSAVTLDCGTAIEQQTLGSSECAKGQIIVVI